MVTDYIARLREAGEKATAGPWSEAETFKLHDPRGIHVATATRPDSAFAINDAAFIALARNNWDALVEVVAAAEAINEQIQRAGYSMATEETRLKRVLRELRASVGEGDG